MVHAIKVSRKLGFGLLTPEQAEKLHATVEAGYFAGSLLFFCGTIYFFPIEGLEDFALGCRLYEVGSLIFMVLTFYTELDGYKARKREDENRKVTQRELLEQLLYCVGSFVFLVGTFLFDPPFVKALSSSSGRPEGQIEDAAAALFMVGSFMFSLGSYVNALSIFEAPRFFRKHLITVTTCYQFGGLFFIAGTMGYVHAFEPNRNMRWFATWMYMVGCFCYVAGSFLSFVRIVASRQVKWERMSKRLRLRRRHSSKRCHEKIGGSGSSNLPFDLAETSQPPAGGPLGDMDLSPAALPCRFSGDLEEAEQSLAEQLGAILGPEAGQELAAALRDREDGPLEQEDLFGAFWRSMQWSAEDNEANAGFDGRTDVAEPHEYGRSADREEGTAQVQGDASSGAVLPQRPDKENLPFL